MSESYLDGIGAHPMAGKVSIMEEGMPAVGCASIAICNLCAKPLVSNSQDV